MDVERFETLALAYGGDLGRWPQGERAAAEDFRAGSPDAARRILAAACAFDGTLDAWRAPVPSAELRERIVAAAPRRKAPALRDRGLGFWLSGAGFAAAALAGVVVGFAASSQALSDVRADAFLSSALSNETDATPFTLGAAGPRVT